MKIYKLFANCIPVKGYTRSMILDLQRNDLHLIPNDLFVIISQKDYIDFDLLISENKSNSSVLKEYKNFLLKNELIFEINDKKEGECFTEMSTEFSSPFTITNVIIDLSSKYKLENFISLKNSFDLLGVCALQIRIFNFDFDFENLFNFLDLIEEDSRINDLQFIIKYDDNITINKYLKQLLEKYNRITTISLYGTKKKFKDPRILSFSKTIINESSCGVIFNNISHINTEVVFESMSCNSCLHKKIGIDTEGNIKNCPSMQQDFGNINITSLEEAISHPDYKKYWKLSKDNIEICKDCEFRYICTDCRAYTERTHINNEGLDISKPLKCGYDPYSGEWSEWSTNPLKQKAIQYYGI